MAMLEAGDVVRFHYLWVRQAATGEESGRKARPVCVVVRTPSTPDTLFLFPLTSQPPGQRHTTVAVSEIECRRAGLDHPSWLVLDEFNRVTMDKAFDFETLVPQGTFSASFLKEIAGRIATLVRERRVKQVSRA